MKNQKYLDFSEVQPTFDEVKGTKPNEKPKIFGFS